MRLSSIGFLLTLAATPAFGDADDDAALAAFKAGFTGLCVPEMLEPGSVFGPIVRHDIMMPHIWKGPTEATLWVFPCMAGGDNLTSVIYLKDDIWGLHPVAFSQPKTEVIYVDPAVEASAAKEIKVLAWTASPFLTNAKFDPETVTMSNLVKWRGLDDASESGTWLLVEGDFHLTRFEVDASFDGKVNPEAVFPAP